MNNRWLLELYVGLDTHPSILMQYEQKYPVVPKIGGIRETVRIPPKVTSSVHLPLPYLS